MNHSSRVDHYIESLPDEERLIAEKIRELVFEMVPNVDERFSFKIPFYHYYGMFCYINRLKTGGVELAFCRGKDLVLAYPELDMKGRAMIAGIIIPHIRKMQVEQIRNLIAGAAAWQQEAFLAKKPFVKVKKSSSSRNK